ncbi:hypothetical protein C2S52_010648 [Perilla frutescens var. hirtella]|nr:hypothetical protein C2S52_010648 [Perilla frutescens var. hirtella]
MTMLMLRSSIINYSVFHILILCILVLNTIYGDVDINSDQTQMQIAVPVRVVLDMNSSFSGMVNLCMDMAIADFYSSHSNYETRLQLHKKETKNALDFNLAVVELVKNEEALAILGSGMPIQEAFAAEVGEAAMVPIVSFTARSWGLSPNPNPENSYIFRTAWDDAVQAEALAAICGRFEWGEAVILYEDTENGNQFLSHTIKAFQDADIRLTYMVSIPVSAEDSDIEQELNTVNAKQTRVFLVHMNPVLGSRLFALAYAAGMMSEGYAWIVTDRLSIFLNSVDSKTRDVMDGVVGLRPYVFDSNKLKSFRARWTRNMLLSKTADPVMDLNVYGLWAYDTVTALAIAAENTNHSSLLLHVNKTGLLGMYSSSFVSELSKTKFRGIAGDFELVEGKLLKCSAYEIFNIIGNGERRVGFWSGERGITREVEVMRYSKSNNEMKKVVWPGDSIIQPKGWSIPPRGSLRVGVPWRSGFMEFVKVVIDPATNQTHATGFAVDVFLESLKQLPFPVSYAFHCINDSTEEEGDWSANIMLQKKIKEYDIVVADTTIWAPRAQYTDFSLPYSESGIVLVVKNKKPFDMWIFVRPLRWDLWVAIIVASMLIGVVLRVLENGGTVSPNAEQYGLIYWSPIAILAFQDRNMVSNKWSVLVLMWWLFTAFILMQSFTANLSAILKLDQLKFSFSQDYYVGYQEGSFVKTFLTENLNINESRLKGYSSIQGFHDGMSKGSNNGGVDAIIDELPYMKLLLNSYDSQYKIVGPTYRTDGFGFAFPPESPLVRYFSKAILNVTQGPTMTYIECKNLGPGYSSQDPLSSVFSQGTSSLALHQFAGLFLLTGSFLLLALFCSQTSIGPKLTRTTQHFLQTYLTTFNTPVTDANADAGNHGIQQDAHHNHNHNLDGAQQDPQEISETALPNTAQNAGEDGLELLVLPHN